MASAVSGGHQQESGFGPAEFDETRDANVDETADLSAIELTDALQQPLTAACNYIGAAQMLLRSRESVSTRPLIEKLEMAETQILRAGTLIRQFQRDKG
jgi:hypothetical protein